MVTEEVWVLANNMTVGHSLILMAIVFAIGYGSRYKADDDRDPERASEVGGNPVRFISLMLVSYGSMTVLAFAVTAPDTFVSTIGSITDPVDRAVFTAKAIGVGAIISVVGAATADSVF